LNKKVKKKEKFIIYDLYYKCLADIILRYCTIDNIIINMITIVQAEKILSELTDELPEIFFKELSGGVILLPETKRSPVKGADGLYILGEYHRNINLGRYIVIYYGSFRRVHGSLQYEDYKNELRKVLRHEFRHHMESLAGERGLEVEDAKFIRDYLNKTKKHD
jgi:hypothetical protein